MALLTSSFGTTNSSKWYDESKTFRIYDALGDVQFFKGLTPEPCDDVTGLPTRFTITQVGTNTVVNSLTSGDWLTVSTGGSEYDGINLQAKGEAFKLETGKPFYFGAKLAISDATQSDLLIGLAETKTDLMNVSGSHAVTSTAVEGVFFVKLDGVTSITARTYEAGVNTNSASVSSAIDTSAHIYEIVWDGVSQLQMLYDGLPVACFTGTLPNGDLTPALNLRAGEAVAKVCEVSWVRCFQALS